MFKKPNLGWTRDIYCEKNPLLNYINTCNSGNYSLVEDFHGTGSDFGSSQADNPFQSLIYKPSILSFL